MSEFVIFRHGANAANQSMTPVMPVGIVHAETREAALEIAQRKYTCYANQQLEAVPGSACDYDQWLEAMEREDLIF